MSDCKGLFGKLFGHSFRTYVVSSEPPKLTPEEIFWTPISWDIEALTKRTYKIACRRCGTEVSNG